MNLVHLLEESAKKFSWRKFLVAPEGVYSFRSLNSKADQLARGLSERLGIQKGEKVAILLNNCPEFIIALFAVLKAGAVCVPLNIFLVFNELKYVLKDCRSKLLISSSEFLQILEQISQARQKDLADLKNIVLLDKKTEKFLYWPELFVKKQVQGSLRSSAAAGRRGSSGKINPQDLALLIYTSGTTGVPKGVMLSHGNLYSNVISSVQALRFSPAERFLLVLPMFHSFTLTVCILVPLYAGARVIIIKSVRPFQRVLRSILLNRVTVIVGIPHLFDILKNLTLPPLLKLFLRVKVCISGAAPLNIETLKVFQERFTRIALLEGYGLTEASPVVSLNPLQGIRKPGSIGLALPGVEVKIAREDESEAACGEIGELIVKGPNVMLGYFNRPQETEQTLRGGWLFTGDMAKIDSEGYIYIVGRKKEMIITHGMNVYPLEVENVLKAHPKVKEAAVAGKQDKSKGETLVAFIVLQQDCYISEKEIIDYCKRQLANYKIPRLIEFRADLPKTPTGKILKRKLF